MKKLTVAFVALTVLLGLAGTARAGNKASAGEQRATADATLSDLVAAYTVRGDYLRAYCLLYAKLAKDPEDGQTRARLERLQSQVSRAKETYADEWTRSATLGFYHFTAGNRIKARKAWGVALKKKSANPAVRERILQCLLITGDAAAAVAQGPAEHKAALVDAPADIQEEFK